MSPSISVILPAYNEEKNIPILISKVIRFLQEKFEKFEIILVDDGSSDQTFYYMEKWKKKFPEYIVLIRHLKNRGYGATLRSGIEMAKGDAIFFMDSDNQFDIRELEYFLPHLATFSIIAGFRVYRYDTVLRCLLSWVYNRLVSVLFGISIKDIDCAYKLFKKEVFQEIHIETDDFFVNAEIMGKSSRLGFSIFQMGVRHYPRYHGRTTVRPSHIPQTLWTILKLYRRIMRLKRLPSIQNAESLL
ncbi:MAG: glycosyltransferase family 2 protein [Deltaproteobacteria bacterium]|nr:glycosyltransferase family 2 protein [Deltaproteobacteria bacterium]